MTQQVRVASVVIEQNGTYLLIQEGKGDAYGLWNLPGGHVDDGETLEQAAIREAKEETGYIVMVLKQLAVFQKMPENHLLHAYLSNIVGGELHFPKDEILDAKWFSYQQIMDMKDIRAKDYVVQAIKAAKST